MAERAPPPAGLTLRKQRRLARNDELRASLEYRRRLLDELQKTDRSISTLRGAGAGIDDPLLRDEAPLIDGEVVVRDREGRIVGRWILKEIGRAHV